MSATKGTKAKAVNPSNMTLRSARANEPGAKKKQEEEPEATAAPKTSEVQEKSATKSKVVSALGEGQPPLTPDEIAFLIQARKDDKKAEAYRKSTPQGKATAAAKPASEAVNPQVAAYEDVLGENAILNEVHAHCLGIVQLEPAQLRAQVQTALVKAKTWSLLPGAKEKVKDAVTGTQRIF